MIHFKFKTVLADDPKVFDKLLADFVNLPNIDVLTITHNFTFQLVAAKKEAFQMVGEPSIKTQTPVTMLPMFHAVVKYSESNGVEKTSKN